MRLNCVYMANRHWSENITLIPFEYFQANNFGICVVFFSDLSLNNSMKGKDILIKHLWDSVQWKWASQIDNVLSRRLMYHVMYFIRWTLTSMTGFHTNIALPLDHSRSDFYDFIEQKKSKKCILIPFAQFIVYSS